MTSEPAYQLRQALRALLLTICTGSYTSPSLTVGLAGDSGQALLGEVFFVGFFNKIGSKGRTRNLNRPGLCSEYSVPFMETR